MRLRSRGLFALLPGNNYLFLLVIVEVELDIELVSDLVYTRPTSTDNVLDILSADIKLRGLNDCAMLTHVICGGELRKGTHIATINLVILGFLDKLPDSLNSACHVAAGAADENSVLAQCIVPACLRKRPNLNGQYLVFTDDPEVPTPTPHLIHQTAGIAGVLLTRSK